MIITRTHDHVTSCIRALVVAFCFFVFFFCAYSAHALTVSPVRIELAGDAGKIVTSEILLFNEQTTDSTFYFSFANFEAQGETGTPNFVESNVGLSTWIETPQSIVLKAGEQTKIPVIIRIPEGTQPGGYFAGIFLSTTPTSTSGGGEVSIGAKIGILALLRVNGDIAEEGGVIEFSTEGKRIFFSSLPVNLAYRFQNSGGDRINPKGNIVIRNTVGIKSATLDANPMQGNVLPFGNIRKFSIVWNGSRKIEPVEVHGFFGNAKQQIRHFAFGMYRAHLHLEYGANDKQASAVTTLFIFPWQLMVIVFVLIGLIYVVGRSALRKYNAWVIGQAKQMIQAEHEAENHAQKNKKT